MDLVDIFEHSNSDLITKSLSFLVHTQTAMATYAALVSLMQVISDVQHHPSPPVSLDKQLVDSIAQHVTFFQQFLHAYNPSLDQEPTDPLEMRIMSAAYAAEDAIEFHILDSIKKSSGSKVAHLTNLFKPPQEQKKANDEKIKSINLCRDRLQTVIEEMDSIKKVVVGKVDTQEEKKKKKVVVRDNQVPMKNVASHKETMVVLDAASLQIMEKLTGGQLDRQAIPIVGMGGIGKTFLAKTVYTQPLIKEHFYICAWATISQQYNTGEILGEILLQSAKKDKEQLDGENTKKEKKQLMSEKSEDELGSELRKNLFGRRFLIVLDDMWSIDAWDKIQRFFPNNSNGSRVLITTRLSQLSSQLNNDYNLPMGFLDKSSSWDLFSKTVFGDNSSCPHELKEIGEKIVDNCRGLPLSITVVGGLLKKMDANRASWESIQDNMSSLVNMENEKHCLRLLKMSYSHLLVHLKPCFLYMGVFKEDAVIRVGSLVRLWILEGFLKPADGETLETTGRGFIQDLVNRNLILVHKLGSTGTIKCCQIHDLLRDLCLKEGQKEGFYHVIGQRDPPPPQGRNTQRRIVIQSNITSGEEEVGDELRSMSYARSVTCQYDKNVNMRLLRTLHLSGCESFQKTLPFGSVNLRHLNIKGSSISSSLFQSVASNTWNLHTLKVECNDPFWAIRSICFSNFWKLPQLRHIEFVGGCFHIPNPPSDGDSMVIIMENIRTLKVVSNFKCCEGVVKRIPNIEKLKLDYDVDSGDGEYFVENIQYLRRLESLSIHSVSGYVFHKLTFPHSLKKLTLGVTQYIIDWEYMMEKVGSLPHLEKLQVWDGQFRNREWEVVEGQFPALKHMKLKYTHLKKWTAAEEGSNIFPCLERLILGNMRDLEKIPLELGNINTLKSIKMHYCGEEAVRCAKELVDEQVESQGEEQLSFHVEVRVYHESEKHLLSLAGPGLTVKTK